MWGTSPPPFARRSCDKNSTDMALSSGATSLPLGEDQKDSVSWSLKTKEMLKMHLMICEDVDSQAESSLLNGVADCLRLDGKPKVLTVLLLVEIALHLPREGDTHPVPHLLDVIESESDRL